MTDPTKFLPDLIAHEGSTTWMYRDVIGYATVGVGNLIHDVDDACALPFVNVTAGRAATPDEVRKEFTRVMSQQRGMRADAYRASGLWPRIELTSDAVNVLLVKRLTTEFLPGLAKLIPGFDGLPDPAQSALLDMAFNLGLRGLERFGHMLAAVDQRDWREAARQCHRATCREERNAWTAAKFNEAAAVDPPPRAA